MIRMDYINDTYTFESDDILRPYSKYLNSCLDDMEPVFSEYSLVCDKIDLELMMMESVSETTMMIYEDAKKSFLQRVGEKILELRDKFIEFIDKIIDKIKTFSFNHKSNEQKLRKLLKEHPEFKNDTLMAVKEGTLNLNNIESLKKLNDDFDEIIKLAKKGNVDPNSLKGKFEDAKEKHEKRLKKAAEIGKNTSIIITASLALATFGPKLVASFRSAEKSKAEQRKFSKNIYETLFMIKDETGTDKKPEVISTKTKEKDIIKRDKSGKPILSDVPLKDEKGKTVMKDVLDDAGKPMKDQSGKKIQEPEILKQIKRDENGKPVTDSNGKVVMEPVRKPSIIGKTTRTVITTSQRTKVTHKYGEKDKKGNIIEGSSIDNQKAQILLKMDYYSKGEYAKINGENLKMIDRMKYAYSKFLDDHVISDKDKKEFHNNMRNGNIDKDETTITKTTELTYKINDDGKHESGGKTWSKSKTVNNHKSSS